MKKIKGTIIFSIIFIVILILDFILYNNINYFLPSYENKLYSYANTSQIEQKEFLFEMYEQIEMQSNYKIIDEKSFEELEKNNTLYNIIKNSILDDIDELKLKDAIMEIFYIGEMQNTIYGDFKIFGNPYIGIGKIGSFLILYSQDMKKIYYLNIDEKNMIESINYENEYGYGEVYEIRTDNDNDYDYDYDKFKYVTQDDKKSKTELIYRCKEFIKNMLNYDDFEPETIMYKENYYILKEPKRDITIYYNASSNMVIGFYIGFGK